MRQESNYHGIEFSSEEIARFCRRHGISRLSLYGSILREDFGPESDIDILVEFEPARVPSILGMVKLEIELSEMLGRKVDLRTPSELSRHFREQVIGEAEPRYGATR
jgi:predicted nucleotidyltransferase